MLQKKDLKWTLSLLLVFCVLVYFANDGAIAATDNGKAQEEAVFVLSSSADSPATEDGGDKLPPAEDSGVTDKDKDKDSDKDKDGNKDKKKKDERKTDVLKGGDGDKKEESAQSLNVEKKKEEAAESLSEEVKENEQEDALNAEPITASFQNNGVKVNVNAPAASFPAGTEVTIKPVRADQTATTFDITFKDDKGKKVQPQKAVLLSFEVAADSPLLGEEKDKTKLSVVHVAKGNKEEVLKSAVIDEGPVKLEIRASHFSEYGIVGETVQTKGTRDAVSTNLADFLSEVTINASTDANGNYLINPYNSYGVNFKFSETEHLQFADSETLTYTFPAGMIVSNHGQATFSIEVQDASGVVVVDGNTYEVVNGELRVNFNTSDPNFALLTSAANTSFTISISSHFDQSITSVEFNTIIIKDFVFEENSELTITKSVAYDMATDTASYVVQVTSLGDNENVVIQDRLTGTALIFNKDVVIESNKTGTLTVTPDYTSVDNGYSVTIPQMTNGEILTLGYTAAVDNTKISSQGTVEQTDNTARVKSDEVSEWKEASANFAGQVTFHVVSKAVQGDLVEIGDGTYEQNWFVTVNANHKIPMGGAVITDFIPTSNRPYMRFAGDGISIKVTLEDGTTEIRFVTWSELTLGQDADGIYQWEYLTPEADGKATYEITCKTKIDPTGALNDLVLWNRAQVFESVAGAKINLSVSTADKLAINKQNIASGSTSMESEWQTILSVPGIELPDTRIVDDFPALVYGGQTYIDDIIPDSLHIEGLLEGESYRFVKSTNQRTFIVYFYKSDIQTSATAGLLPTPDGQPREIILRYKTQVNQDWLTLAEEDGYEDINFYKHNNNTSAWAGSFNTTSPTASVYPVRPKLEKTFVERDEAVIDGVTYPVFRYTLAMSGPTADGIVIHDAFNTEYLRFYETQDVSIRGGKLNNLSNTSGAASAAMTADGMDITVTSFPKDGEGRFYPFYELSYSLIVKDAEALAALNSAASATQAGVDLINTATWNDLESSSTVNYTYFPYVDKELLVRPTSDNGYVAEFNLIVNRNADDLDPTSDTLTILDELSSNLRYIPDSLIISPANEAITAQHDTATNTLTFSNVPDGQTYEIRYQARVLGTGNVVFSNTVKFGNYVKTIEENTTVTSSGGGTASNPSITLVKRNADDLSMTLAGAEFQLFYMDGENWVPVKDKDGQNVTFTTGADGKVLIVGHQQSLGWALWEGRTYCLVELIAPDMYVLSETPVYFVLKQFPTTQSEYDLVGDEISAQNTPIKTSVPVNKEWVGPKTESVTVLLNRSYTDGTMMVSESTGLSLVLNEDNQWSGVFENVNKYAPNGAEYEYYVTEEELSGYSTGIVPNGDGSFTIINTNTETLDIPVVKQWVGAPAEAVTVYLTADGEIIETKELTAAMDWQYTFSDLPKYTADGAEILYDVEEEDIEGYIPAKSGTAETGFTLTNTITGKVSIPVTKEWIGPAAESITLNLLANGEVVDEVTLSDANNWQHTFADLEKYDAEGREIGYDIEEPDLDGYSVDIVENNDGSFTIINTNTAMTAVSVTKQWVGTAAESVSVNLLADGTVIDSIELTEADDWQYTFADLPKYDSGDGHEISYDVEEEDLEGYIPAKSGTAETGFTLTNTITGKVSIPVTKQWIGPAAESVVIELLAGGAKVDEVTLAEANGWQHTFADLPKYDMNGEEISYDIEEADLDGYAVDIVENDDGSFTIINTNTETLDISVVKQWVGAAAESVSVNLLADGKVIDSIELTEAASWQHTFGDLPKYSSEDGHEISYDVEEEDLEGYIPAKSGTAETGFTLTNTITGKVSVPVTKQWIGPAAESVTLKLLANGEVVDEVTLSDANNWQHTFADLEKYDAEGQEISYDIEEADLDGYAVDSVENDDGSFTITNTNTETLDIPVVKQWVGAPAASVTVYLTADGAVIDTQELTAATGWQHTFSDLPKYDSGDGHEISYDVEEEALENYIPAKSGTAETGFILTNTITGKVSIPVTKQWIGPAARSVTLRLLANGEVVEEVTLSEDDGWQHTFRDLPKYDRNGEEISYEIEEADLENYSGRIIKADDGSFTIINTNTETLDIPVVKQWVGAPASAVSVKLTADGTVIATRELTAAVNWQYTFADLPKYDAKDGHEISYDVEEEPLEGYLAAKSGTAETGFTFTNTITGKVSIPVTKVWIGPAAKSVVIELLAGGEKVREISLSEANKWQYTFTDLPKYDDKGAEIKYSIREIKLTGYKSVISEGKDGFTITNINTETRAIDVTKQWVGAAADSVTIKLLADGKEIETVKLDAKANWKHTFADLPKYDAKDGHEISYGVKEEALSGYSVSISGDMDKGFTITNRKDPLKGTTSDSSSGSSSGTSPKTGDDSLLPIWLLTMALSGLSLVGLIVACKKRQSHE